MIHEKVNDVGDVVWSDQKRASGSGCINYPIIINYKTKSGFIYNFRENGNGAQCILIFLFTNDKITPPSYRYASVYILAA